jgi:hypothetical protein
VKDIQISFDSPWNKIHWKSITTAYRNSPYFEYFESDFEKLFSHPHPGLFAWNMQLLKKILEIFSISIPVSLTAEYDKKFAGTDLRNLIHPKKNIINIKRYHQVFETRNGFINDLSVLDYLFNEGNNLGKTSIKN